MNEADAYDAFDPPGDDAVEFLGWLAASCRFSSPIRVLDVGCGTGRLLVALSDLGWRVTGLEPHAEYFDNAVDRATAIPGVEVRRGGFADLSDSEAFELVAAINGPFQYLTSQAERRSALAGMFRALVPGGVMVLDMANFLYILRHYSAPRPQSVPFRGGQLTRTVTHAIDFHDARFVHRDHFEFAGREGERSVSETTHAFSIASWPEISSLARSVGFVDLKTYQSLRGRREERLDGPRIVISARRPG